MIAGTAETATHPARLARSREAPVRRRRINVNIPGGIGAFVWLLIVVLPIYFIVVTSLRLSEDYLTDGALTPPRNMTLDAYRRVFELDFGTFMLNSLIVTVSVVVLVISLALPAAYAIVRNTSPLVRTAFTVLLLGLAIPAQAVIIPLYLLITRLHLYDSLVAVILPTTAFALPLAIVVLTSTLRDIPGELYEAMTVDGARTGRIFRTLVIPLSWGGVTTIAIFSGLSAWNGVLFPLILTQSEQRRVIPMGLYNFQGQYGTDIPGLMAAVVLSALPVLVMYVFGRRYLLRGLTAGAGK